MTRLLRTIRRCYFANHIEKVRGAVKGLGRIYRIIGEEYKGNPFAEGFCEGGLHVVDAYTRAFRTLGAETRMDSWSDVILLGIRAQMNMVEDAEVKIPSIHVDVPTFMFRMTEAKANQ